MFKGYYAPYGNSKKARDDRKEMEGRKLYADGFELCERLDDVVAPDAGGWTFALADKGTIYFPLFEDGIDFVLLSCGGAAAEKLIEQGYREITYGEYQAQSHQKDDN